MTRRRRAAIVRARRLPPASLALACALALQAAATIADAQPADADVLAVSPRGMVGVVTFEHAGLRLRAKLDQDRDAPMLVRLAEVRERADGAFAYDLEFMGAVEGDYDLATLLELEDGTPARPGIDAPSLPVRVVSQLPDDAGTDVFVETDPPPSLVGGYRAALIALGVAWLAVPVLIVARRALRRPPPPPAPPPPPPSLADRLRPLVLAAARGTLSVDERGRLELLLHAHWRERLGLVDLAPAAAIARMREHPEAGALLQAIERWLHARPGAEPEAARIASVAALLEPYRAVPAPEAPA